MADMVKFTDPKKKDDIDERIGLARKGIVKVDPTEGGTAK